MTAEQIHKRQQEIMNSYSVLELVKGDTLAMNRDAREQAIRELKEAEQLKKPNS